MRLAWACWATITACSEPAVTLPDDWNTLVRRSAEVDVYGLVAPDVAIVKALSGLSGSPIGLAAGAPDLTHAWWNRPAGTDERDGAHVDLVRVAADPCALTLDALFPDPADSADDVLTDWREQIVAARAVGGDVMWQAGFSAEPNCGTPGQGRAAALATPGPWVGALGRALDLEALDFVELLDPETLVLDTNLTLYGALAGVVQARGLPVVAGGFEVTSDVVAGTALADFVARVAARAAPLDVLTFAMEATTPAAIADAARAIRKLLDDAGLGATDIGLVRFGPIAAVGVAGADGAALASAARGAFEMATRVALQEVASLRFAISDSGAAAGPYFDLAGVPTPAFMARFPMRQLAGKKRVPAVATAPDVSVLAAVEPDGGPTLHLLVVAWDVSSGVGYIDYEVHVPAFVPPAIERVDYRFAELDAESDSLGAFFFSDADRLRPDPRTGDVTVSYRLPVPGVHYLEIQRPSPGP